MMLAFSTALFMEKLSAIAIINALMLSNPYAIHQPSFVHMLLEQIDSSIFGRINGKLLKVKGLKGLV